MKIQRLIVTVCFIIFSLLSSFVLADISLVHNVGEVEMLISDWGALSQLDEEYIYPNFVYSGRFYMSPFSEIWVGNSVGYVASAYDGFEGEEEIYFGEWQAIEDAYYITDSPSASQQIHARYASNRYTGFPLMITIDQYSYAWDSTLYPDDDDYVIIKLVLTNSGLSQINDLYIAIQTDWDVDLSEEEDDLIDWDIQRHSGIAYDSDGTFSTQVALTLISGKFASHNIVDFKSWRYLDSDRANLMSNGEMDNLETIGSISSNYLNVISAGPYDVPIGGSVSVVYAFVAGQDRKSLLQNIDSAIAKAMTPEKLDAMPSAETIKLTWSQSISPEVASYRIYRKTGADGEYSMIAEVSAEESAYIDNTTKRGTEYHYFITAVIDGIESRRSNEVYSTPGVPPPPPANLTIKNGESARLILHWQAPDDDEVTEYKIFRNSTGSAPWTQIATVSNSELSFIDSNIYDGNTYYYVVASVNSDGWVSEYSNVVSLTVNLPKPMASSADLSKVTVAPNPCGLSSNLKFIRLTPVAKIRIYTFSGELVRTLYHNNGTGEEVWDLRNDTGEIVANGTYIYYVEAYKTETTEKFTATGKIAIVR